MRLHVRGGLNDVGRAVHPANPPPRHRVCLGNAVKNKRLICELGNLGKNVRVLQAVVGQVLVDLIGNDPDAVLESPLANRLRLLL